MERTVQAPEESFELEAAHSEFGNRAVSTRQARRLLRQQPINVVAEVRVDRVSELEAFLAKQRDPNGKTKALPFEQVESIHFARVVLLPASQESVNEWIAPRLVLAAEVDGAPETA